MIKKTSNDDKVIGRIISEIKPYGLQVIISLLLALATVVLNLRIPILTGRAVDCLIGPAEIDWDGLVLILKEMSVTVVAAYFTQWFMSLIYNKITYGVTKSLRDRAFETLQNMPLSNIDGHGHGDYMSRIVTDADAFSDGLLLGFTQLFTGVLTIVGTIIFMMMISVPIALVVVVLTPLSLYVAKFISSRTYEMFKSQATLRGKETSYIEEMIDNQQIVKNTGYENKAIENFVTMNEELKEASLKATFFSSLPNPSTRFVNGLIYNGVACAGALLAIGGGISIGGLTSFLAYASSYSKPFNEISGVVTELQNAFACAGRLYEMIDTEIESDEGNTSLGSPKGRIEFKHVYFSYNKEKPLIEDLNLTVEPGQRVAIVGPTGGGKSTIINLLMRFYELDSGSITIDGTDIKDISREELRSNFGMVLQETWLKEGTVFENLSMANPDATLEEVKEAAKLSHAHSFIKRLPEGYDTIIKEGKGMLSAGQRQLLCITRVMLKLPPMLILDEATSSIDTRTEQKIQAAFNTMMKGRTTFVVAHRLSTIKGADMILFVKDGKVVEQGNHTFLLQKGGFYAKLYQSQFEET